MAYWEKEIRSLMGKAIHRYDLIQEGDRILVGVSGGKDSLTLLHLLHERRKRVPIHYELFPVYIDLGFRSGRAEILKNFFETKGLPYHIEFTDIGRRANSSENRENPCFLCAWERRKRLFHLAHHFKCNKIALGHHQDDIIETLLLNIFFSAEISTMVPSQSLFKGKITLIRPLALIEEKKIERFAREMKLPFGPSGCPSSGKTKRKVIKDLIEDLSKRNRKVKGNIFRAISNIKLDYTLTPEGHSR
ncbi:MAG: tRNA 2-thiocytidine(32) synthetase TtcA [Syntrophaceae bacterium]|nr:tRNA 2-thiocytidine(32) synthetase TtcA [Syntrophaceae bacterium]